MQLTLLLGAWLAVASAVNPATPGASNGLVPLTGLLNQLNLAKWAVKRWKKAITPANPKQPSAKPAPWLGASKGRVPLITVQDVNGIIDPCPQGGADPYYYTLVFTTNTRLAYAAKRNQKAYKYYTLQGLLKTRYDEQAESFHPKAMDVKTNLVDALRYTARDMDGKPVPHGAFADFIRKQILVLSYDRFIQTVQTPMFQMPAVVKPTKKADDNSGGLDQSGPDSSPPTQSKACGIVINRRASYHPEGSIASGSQVPQRSSAKPPVIYASKNTPVTVNNRQTSTPIVYTGPALEVVAQAMVLTLTSEKIAAAQVHLLVKLAFSSGILQFVRVDPPKEL